jgi:curved DNA-binding protein CbpA
MQPPHDMSLYNILQVSPNATAAQITKSYRKLARKYHPDKQGNSKKESPKQLQQVQQAYDILKDDATRLPHHKYGLVDPSLAVILLLGPQDHYHNARLDSLHKELLQLMGYNNHNIDNDSFRSSEDALDHAPSRQQQRVRTIAAQLVEQLRPIVEGMVDANIVAHMVAQDCDRWKTLPLGAQIVRCVGRAYRHAGQDYLRKHKKEHIILSVPMRQQWRQAKHFCTAALASGRATVTERVWTQQEMRRRKKRKRKETTTPSIEYHPIGTVDFLEEDDSDFVDHDEASEEEMKQAERLKAQQTLLQSLQVEALWKISKIDLDKTIRQACNLILKGNYFFFPSHQSLKPTEWNRGGHGWVTASGKMIHADEARLKAAEAMAMIGEIMVQRSKEGTSWKD